MRKLLLPITLFLSVSANADLLSESISLRPFTAQIDLINFQNPTFWYGRVILQDFWGAPSREIIFQPVALDQYPSTPILGGKRIFLDTPEQTADIGNFLWADRAMLHLSDSSNIDDYDAIWNSFSWEAINESNAAFHWSAISLKDIKLVTDVSCKKMNFKEIYFINDNDNYANCRHQLQLDPTTANGSTKTYTTNCVMFSAGILPYTYEVRLEEYRYTKGILKTNITSVDFTSPITEIKFSCPEE